MTTHEQRNALILFGICLSRLWDGETSLEAKEGKIDGQYTSKALWWVR